MRLLAYGCVGFVFVLERFMQPLGPIIDYPGRGNVAEHVARGKASPD